MRSLMRCTIGGLLGGIAGYGGITGQLVIMAAALLAFVLNIAVMFMDPL